MAHTEQNKTAAAAPATFFFWGGIFDLSVAQLYLKRGHIKI